MTEPILLKKYANRRLYDTNQSAYVTLEEVAGSDQLSEKELFRLFTFPMPGQKHIPCR